MLNCVRNSAYYFARSSRPSLASSQRKSAPFKSTPRRLFHTSKIARITYYEILDVAPDASPASITEAYRKKAKELHPDLNKASNAQEQFLALQYAYTILRDPKKRKEYDASTIEVSYAANNTGDVPGSTTRVVRRRSYRTWWLFAFAGLVILWFRWNTFTTTSEEEIDAQAYIKNPRKYNQSRNAKRENEEDEEDL